MISRRALLGLLPVPVVVGRTSGQSVSWTEYVPHPNAGELRFQAPPWTYNSVCSRWENRETGYFLTDVRLERWAGGKRLRIVNETKMTVEQDMQDPEMLWECHKPTGWIRIDRT